MRGTIPAPARPPEDGAYSKRSSMEQTYKIYIGELARELPLYMLGGGKGIYILDTLGDRALIQIAARNIVDRVAMTKFKPDLIVAPAVKGIPIAHELAFRYAIDYIVLEKAMRPYYQYTSVKIRAITHNTRAEHWLHLSHKDRAKIARRKVLLVDDVMSTGNTMQGMETLCSIAGAIETKIAVIATEGFPCFPGVIRLTNLPIVTLERGGR